MDNRVVKEDNPQQYNVPGLTDSRLIIVNLVATDS